MNKIALCCIAKIEEQYIDEWINYNIKLGFDHIFVYENNWEYPIDNPKVTVIPFPGEIRQLPAYNHCLKTYKKSYDYIAFFDCDEYLVLKNHNTIQEFVEEYQTRHAIGINWAFFGANGRMFRDPHYPKSLLKQFFRRQKGINKHIKVIVNTKSNAKFDQNPHCVSVPAMDTNRNTFFGPFHPTGIDDVAYICHFYLKTEPDWRIRMERGRADTTIGRPENEWWEHRYDNCEEEDTTARKFLYGS